MNKLKLLYIKIKQNKWINKYTITTFIFVIIIVFFDSSSFIKRYKAHREKQQLQEEIDTYKENIKHDEALLEALNSNIDSLERFAREEYTMQKSDEDIFIIKED